MRKIFRSPLALIILGVAVIGAGIAAYWQFYMVAPPQYRLQAAENGDISQTVSANGTINPVTLVSECWHTGFRHRKEALCGLQQQS